MANPSMFHGTIGRQHWRIDPCLLPIIAAACMPMLSALALTLGHSDLAPTAPELMLHIIGTAAPFVALKLLHRYLRADRHLCCVCVRAGLTAVALGWTWVTLDCFLFDGLGTDTIGVLLWLLPTIAAAMVASYRLDQAFTL